MSEWAFLCIILSIFATIAGFILYLRNVSEINIRSGCPPIKNITLAYKFKEGPYTNWEQVFMECKSIASKVAYIRVFYDDPKKVQGGRYAVGSILSEGGGRSSQDLWQDYEKAGFKFFSFPEVTHVVTTSYPHSTFLSILLGVRQVYPHLEDYIKERKLCAHPFLEIYREGLIQYMVPLARQGDFYVPELRQTERRLSAREDSGSETDISGAESNSEYSSESGLLLSDSRDTSLARSSVHSAGRRSQRGERSREGSTATQAIKDKDLDLSKKCGVVVDGEE